MLTEKQKEEIIKASFEEIKKGVVEEATRAASWQVEQALTGIVKETVRNYFNEKIAPLIVENLNDHKSQIIEAAVNSADAMAVELAKSLSASLAENLGTSYKRKKIFEAMFE